MYRDENINLEYIPWDEIHLGLINIAKNIIREGIKIDAIIAIAKGGYIPARIMSDLLGVENIGVITVKFYKKAGVAMAKPLILHPLTIRVDNKNVLIVDDVIDSGRTMQLVMEEVSRHGALDIKTLALYVKPWSTIKPDYFIRETRNWVVFPWEIVELCRELGVEALKRLNNMNEKMYKEILDLIDLLIK